MLGASVLKRPQSKLHEANRTVIGGIPGGGAIINQVRCNASLIYFRQLQGSGSSVVTAPIIDVSRDGKSSHVFDFLGLSYGDLKGLTVTDFAVSDAGLYLLARTADLMAHVLQFEDGSGFAKQVPLDDSKASAKAIAGDLTSNKLAVMPTGDFLVVGVRSRKQEKDGRPDYRYTPTMELYSPDGRFISPVSFKNSEIDLNDPKHGQAENFLPIDLALSATSPDGIYFAIQGGKLTVYRISLSGEISTNFALEADKDFRATNMAVVNGQLLVEWATSSEKNSVSKYSLYRLTDGTPFSTYTHGPALGGIFACFDGRRTFTFLSSDRMGQRLLKFANP